MALQYSLEAANASLDAKVAILGPSSVLKIFSSPAPKTCAGQSPSGLLVSIPLPHPCMSEATGGIIRKTGEWRGTVSAGGRAASFRICDAAGNCHWQGRVTLVGGGGELLVKRLDLSSGQTFIVGSFSVKASV